MKSLFLILISLILISCSSTNSGSTSSFGGLLGSDSTEINEDNELTDLLVDKESSQEEDTPVRKTSDSVIEETDLAELEALVMNDSSFNQKDESLEDEKFQGIQDTGLIQETLWVDVEPIENTQIRFFLENLTKSELFQVHAAVSRNLNFHIPEIAKLYDNEDLSDSDIQHLITGLSGSMQKPTTRKYFVYLLEGKNKGSAFSHAQKKLEKSPKLSESELELAEALIDNDLHTEAQGLLRDSFSGRLPHNQRKMIKAYLGPKVAGKVRNFIRPLVRGTASEEYALLATNYISLKYNNRPFPVFKRRKLIVKNIKRYNRSGPVRSVASVDLVPQNANFCDVRQKQLNYLGKRGLRLLISTNTYCVAQKGSLIFRINNCNPCR